MDNILPYQHILRIINIAHKMILFNMDNPQIKGNFMIILILFRQCGRVIIPQYIHGLFIWIIFRLFIKDRHIVSYKY